MEFKKKNVFLVTFVIAIVAIDRGSARSCNNVRDCACGEQCVHGYQNQICNSVDCNGTCKRGCAVKYEFIASGDSKTVYCNICRCSSGKSNGTPACTKRMWCNLPRGIPLYQNNPKCYN